MRDTIKYARGTVWFVNDDFQGQGSIQSKSRPYLVVSNNMNNSNSTVIHMAPITSQPKGDYPHQVEFYDYINRKNNTILLGQIMPKSLPHISICSNYMYTMSEEIMDKVDEALHEHFALTYSNKEEDVVVNSPEVDTPAEEPVVYHLEESPSQIEKFNKRLKKYKEVNGEIEIPRTRGGRIKWNDELRAQFLKDAQEMYKEAVMEKYGMKESTYHTNVSMFRKILKLKN